MAEPINEWWVSNTTRDKWRRRRYAEDAEYREKMLAANAAWRARNPEKFKVTSRAYQINLNYGLTMEEYDELAKNGCHLCGKTKEQNGNHHLSVDHDHNCCPKRPTCGRCIRGVLCWPCNRMVGWLENNLHQVLDYLGGIK